MLQEVKGNLVFWFTVEMVNYSVITIRGQSLLGEVNVIFGLQRSLS